MGTSPRGAHHRGRREADGRPDDRALAACTNEAAGAVSPTGSREAVTATMSGAAQNLTLFSDLRRRLDDPAESFSAEAAHLFRWMDWDWDLERQPEDVRSLAPRIQQALGLLERSRGRR
jgi:hypothetical protein